MSAASGSEARLISEIPLFYFLASNPLTGIDRERQYLMGSLTGAVALRRYPNLRYNRYKSVRISRGASWLYAGISEYDIILI